MLDYHPIIWLMTAIVLWNVIVQCVRIYLRRKDRKEDERNAIQALKNRVMLDSYYRRY